MMLDRFDFKDFVAGCVLALILSSTLPAQQTGTGEAPLTKANLDLPAAAFGIADPDEGIIEIILFFGQQYEGDGFFLVLDRSGSTRNGALAIEQREAVRTISGFSDEVQFGVVFYDGSTLEFPASRRPAVASPGMKSAATGFILSMTPGSGTCVQRGLMAGLQFANASTARRPQIILLTDGYTTCPGAGDAAAYAQQTLSAVTGANFKRIPIHAICAGSDVSESFPQRLARMNNGTYTRIPLASPR